MPKFKTDDGKWIDSQGDAIPLRYVEEIKRREDELVMPAAEGMIALYEMMEKHKASVMTAIQNHLSWMVAKYGAESLNKEGNQTLCDFSRFYRLSLKNAKVQEFDGRLAVAKAKLEEEIERWAVGANGAEQLKVLASDAFEADKAGKINNSKIFALLGRLRGMTQENQQIKEVVDLISDAINIVGRKQYIMLERRSADGGWETVVLNWSRV